MNAKRSPYISRDRYEHPKEDFKTIGRNLAELFASDSELEAADIGCANGELLYYLRKQFPNWKLTGYDRNLEFLDTGRNFPGLRDVELQQAELQDIEGSYDVVIATCFLPLFPEIEAPLDKLLSLCREGGYLLATGLFNPYDIDVRVQYLDHTMPEPEWITDSSRHSQRRIREWLEPRVQSIEFTECTYDLDLSPNPDNPARVWTFRDAEGNSILINGAWQIANQTLMVVHK
ncbi:MAG: class I SAM-dependent methyltransferase [Gammaproteobacteria bacterium]|nr:class I SAM-dependent methyltransferase [Gammaproteobacteria bacterium]